MCIGENDSPKFIRRRKAALELLQGLIERGLSDELALQRTTDKFCLNASLRDDYRIYMALWNLIGD